MEALVQGLLTLVAASGGDHGGGHGDHHVDWFAVGSMIFNAVLFFGFLAYKAKPAIADGLLNRRNTMVQRLEEAQKKQAEAERRLAEYAHKLEHLEEEVARIVKSYEAEAAADQARMEQDTEKAIERLARESDFTIKQEFKKAEKVIRAAAVAATVELAEQLVTRRITDADQRRLTDNYIRDLEKN